MFSNVNELWAFKQTHHLLFIFLGSCVLSLSSLLGIYLLASPTLQLHILFFFLSDDGDALEKHFSAITTVHTWIRWWFFKTLKRDPKRERLDHIITYSNGTEEAPCTSLLTWSIRWGSTLPSINNILVPSLLYQVCSSCLSIACGSLLLATYAEQMMAGDG